MLKKEFVKELEKTGLPFYEIAWRAGITPNQLYKITAGIDRPGPSDKRIKALCRYLGISISEALESYTETEC